MSSTLPWYVSSRDVCWVVLNIKQIHVSKADGKEELPEMAGKATKLMHRFTSEELHRQMDLVEER